MMVRKNKYIVYGNQMLTLLAVRFPSYATFHILYEKLKKILAFVGRTRCTSITSIIDGY